MRPRYYITTPIYYATDEPHIGTAYCTIAADAAARYRRLTGHDVFFLTGTDEHGQKMERKAAELGISPRELADRSAPRFAELWKRFAISNDGFLRTTEERHHAGVKEIWLRMAAKGDVYRGEYEGLYCVGCESFYAEKELRDGRCPDHGTVPERTVERGWFFRLSAYQAPLLAHYERYPEFIQPDTRRNEVRSFVAGGLRDLSISRGTTRWGWPVPGDPEHVIYVWVDALTNYLTGVGWPERPKEAERWWPADVHLVGKDILRFHAIYWPAFLMAAGLELPRQVFGHGWWLREGAKISKSRGGAIKVEPLIERFQADAVRYFLLREIPFGLDGNYSEEGFVRRYNADLANDLGNLVSRTLQMVGRYRGGVVPAGKGTQALHDLARSAVEGWRKHFDVLAFSRGLDAVWEMVRAGNRFIDERAPWSIAKDPQRGGELDEVLYGAAELVRLAFVCLHPVMPVKAAEALGAMGFNAAPTEADLAFGGLRAGTRLGSLGPLFPRVDEKEWLGTAGKEGRRGEMSEETTKTPTAQAGDAAPSAPAQPAVPPNAPAAPAAGAPVAATPPTPPVVTIDEVMKLDLRVARVREAERVPGSKKLLRLQIDDGAAGRQIVAGIADRYTPEALVGKSIVVVANLKPAKLMGVESQGMLLAATAPGGPVVATFEEEVPPGARVK